MHLGSALLVMAMLSWLKTKIEAHSLSFAPSDCRSHLVPKAPFFPGYADLTESKLQQQECSTHEGQKREMDAGIKITAPATTTVAETPSIEAANVRKNTPTMFLRSSQALSRVAKPGAMCAWRPQTAQLQGGLGFKFVCCCFHLLHFGGKIAFIIPSLAWRHSSKLQVRQVCWMTSVPQLKLIK